MNDKAHYVVSEAGFGPGFGAEAARVELLEAQDCAALSGEVANRKHEALLATAP